MSVTEKITIREGTMNMWRANKWAPYVSECEGVGKRGISVYTNSIVSMLAYVSKEQWAYKAAYFKFCINYNGISPIR
jgi:hypothetical protein